MAAVLLLVFAGLVLATEDDDEDEKDNVAAQEEVLEQFEGKTFYTQANIFYEKPMKILSTNFHKGKILPVGSKVTVDYAGGRTIEFIDEKKTTYRITLKRKHTSPGMKLLFYFNQYFAPSNPLEPGGPYSRFTEAEQWSIKNGTLEKGMSRAAVLMAYGYPPSHATPDLKDDKWTYWIGSMHGQPVYVYFKNDRVYKITSAGSLLSE